MKTLHFPVILILLASVFLLNNVALAQNTSSPEIEFDQASYFTKSMNCKLYNIGKIVAQDHEQNNPIIIVTDPNANKFSTSIDKVTVSIWSDSDKKGIEITAYETGVNSGVFKGKFTISDGQSTQDVIHVIDGDTLSARYSNVSSLPLDATNSGITTTSLIGMSCPPFERVPASSIRILDTKGNEHDVTTVGKQVLITSNITNPTSENQNFTYIVQIQDQNGSTASLAWLSGIMLPHQTSSPSVSWTPSKAGNYVAAIFVWQSLTNPNALSPPLSADLTVLHDFTNSKSFIPDTKNLHCQLGFELMTKPADGSPVCVTLGTAQKLAQRGWGMYIPAVTEQDVLSNSIKVPNTNFTINYNISGNNKLVDANMDMQSKSLILSLNATSNGTLTVTLPRMMIDAKLPSGNDDKFYVLVNGQESVFKEINATAINRTLSIPFTNETHVIEIIASNII